MKPESKVLAAVPDDLQHISSILHLISHGGVVPTGHVNWCHIGRRVGGVGVRVPVEGVVPERGAVRGKVRGHLPPDRVTGKDRCIADDRLGIRPAGWWTAGLVGQLTLYNQGQTRIIKTPPTKSLPQARNTPGWSQKSSSTILTETL